VPIAISAEQWAPAVPVRGWARRAGVVAVVAERATGLPRDEAR
jgi:hypothetical protein